MKVDYSIFHHANDFILISNGEETIQCTLSEFLYLEPNYVLSSEFSECEYRPNIRFIKSGDTKHDILSFPWIDGDIYISQVNNYISILELKRKKDEEDKKTEIENSLTIKDKAIRELSLLDPLLPRCVEDLVEQLQNEDSLPLIMKERLIKKRELRNIIKLG